MPEAVTSAAPVVAAAVAATAFADAEKTLLAPNYPLPRLHLASGQGARVRDIMGREYLDFVSGIAVNAFGHAPKGLADALAAQLGTLGHVSNLFANTPGIELAQTLTAATGYDRAFFCNSGTEGIEAALKFARARALKMGQKGRDLLAFKGGFHGRTGFALSATYTPSYREPFLPLIPGIRFADYNDVSALDSVLDSEVCGVLVEPVQGESGAVPATRDFLLALRARTSVLGAALIFDEVQSGMGRSGRLLAQETFDVKGDMTVMSKALGAGLPIAAVLMTEDVAQSLAPGMHGCTFGGNPLCATAANWALSQVLAPGFLEQVRRSAKHLAQGLDALAAKHASVREARGLGLLRAIDLAEGAPFDAPALIAAARERGLLLVRGGERAVRVLPPLNVTLDELNEALSILDAALTHLSAHEGARS
jgi:predicted acetylornithine/succinylornithine family transaminase